MYPVIFINDHLISLREQQIYHFLTSIREFIKTGAGRNKNDVVPDFSIP
jgi:hypothetical protein